MRCCDAAGNDYIVLGRGTLVEVRAHQNIKYSALIYRFRNLLERCYPQRMKPGNPKPALYMKKTTHYKGHRWTTDELRLLMKLWSDDTPLEEIARQLNATEMAISKQVFRLRREGIPLERRINGHPIGMRNKAWTHADVQYLLRRRLDYATAEQIGVELGRTRPAVCAMIQNLRKEQVPVAMRGNGVRRQWDANLLKAFAVNQPTCETVELDSMKSTAQSA